MSDTGRQNFTDKIGSAVKPDSQKTTGEVAKEKLDVSTAWPSLRLPTRVVTDLGFRLFLPFLVRCLDHHP